MTILNIATIPEPVLKQKAAPVGAMTPELERFIGDLAETMRHFPYCVGIAAPQVFKSLRIVAVDVSRARKPQPNHGELILLNPVITFREGAVTGREGCLSIPDLTANVTRATKVTVRALDGKGAPVSLDAEGFEAVVLQHEIDHLDGLLFLDRVTSLKTDVFRRKVYADGEKKHT